MDGATRRQLRGGLEATVQFAAADARVDMMRSHSGGEERLDFVKRQEFCQLLLSRSKLSRCDDPAARICGLVDAESGRRYLIHEAELFPRQQPDKHGDN